MQLPPSPSSHVISSARSHTPIYNNHNSSTQGVSSNNAPPSYSQPQLQQSSPEPYYYPNAADPNFAKMNNFNVPYSYSTLPLNVIPGRIPGPGQPTMPPGSLNRSFPAGTTHDISSNIETSRQETKKVKISKPTGEQIVFERSMKKAASAPSLQEKNKESIDPANSTSSSIVSSSPPLPSPNVSTQEKVGKFVDDKSVPVTKVDAEVTSKPKIPAIVGDEKAVSTNVRTPVQIKESSSNNLKKPIDSTTSQSTDGSNIKSDNVNSAQSLTPRKNAAIAIVNPRLKTLSKTEDVKKDIKDAPSLDKNKTIDNLPPSKSTHDIGDIIESKPKEIIGSIATKRIDEDIKSPQTVDKIHSETKNQDKVAPTQLKNRSLEKDSDIVQSELKSKDKNNIAKVEDKTNEIIKKDTSLSKTMKGKDDKSISNEPSQKDRGIRENCYWIFK